MRNSQVDVLINELDGENKKVAIRLREIILKSLPRAEEAVKWGAPTYLVNGRLVVAISAYAKHVNLQFYKGALLHSRLLEGTGKALRHIKVHSLNDVKEEEFAKLLKEASGL